MTESKGNATTNVLDFKQGSKEMREKAVRLKNERQAQELERHIEDNFSGRSANDIMREAQEERLRGVLKGNQNEQKPAKQKQDKSEIDKVGILQTGLAALKKLIDAVMQMISNFFKRLLSSFGIGKVAVKAREAQGEKEQAKEAKDKAKFMNELDDKLNQAKKNALGKLNGPRAANEELFRMQASALGATPEAQQLASLSDKELADKVAAMAKDGAPADSLLEFTKELLGEENAKNPAVQEVLDDALNSFDNMDYYSFIERKLETSGWQTNLVDAFSSINKQVLSPANKSFWQAIEGEREQYKSAYQKLLAESEQESLKDKETIDYLSAKSIYDEKRIKLKEQVMRVLEKEMPDSDGLSEMVADLIVYDLPQVNASEITANNLISEDLYKSTIKHLCNNCYQDMFGYVAAREHFEQQYQSVDISRAAMLNKVQEDCADALCMVKDDDKDGDVIDFDTRPRGPSI